MAYLDTMYATLRFLGIWHPKRGEHFSYKIRINLIFATILYHGLGVGIYLITSIQDPSFSVSEISEALFVVSGFYNLIFNCLAMYSQRHKLVKLFEILEDFENFGTPPNVEYVSHIINTLTFGVLSYCSIGALLVCLSPVFEYEKCFWINEPLNKTFLCGFGTKTAYPYNMSMGFVLYIHILIQTFSICFACGSGAMIVTCGMAAFEFVILRIEHMKGMLKSVFRDEDEGGRKRRLRNCIVYHIYIIELAKKTNDCFAVATTPALINYSICIGTTLLAFLTGHSFISFVNMGGWVIGIFFMCFTGQRIYDKSTSIAEAVYDMEWYLATPALRRDIQFMIMRANKPIKYHCGVLGDLHYISFKNIMSTGYRFSTLKTGVGN